MTRLGGLDIVVNNAAVLYRAPRDDYSQEQYDRMISINIGGPF
ncbi:SDR family NAD(P)-dependent oxidoreductase [Mycolicibacterium canariasense]